MLVLLRFTPLSAFALMLAMQFAAGAILRAPPVAASPALILASDSCGVEGSCVDVPGRAPSIFRALRMAADGTPAGDPTAAELCVRGLHPQRSAAVSDGAGGIVIAWIEPSDLDRPVRVLRRDSTGAVASGWPATGVLLCGAPGQRNMLRLASDGGGGAIAAWIDHRHSSRGRVFAQRVTANGAIAAGWTTDGVAASADSADQAGISLAPDGMGGAYVAWQRPRPSGTAVGLMRLAADGTRGSGWPDSGLAVCTLDSAQAAPAVIGDGMAGVLVGWEDHRAGAAAQLFVARFTVMGTAAPGWPTNGARVSSATAAQRFARLAGDAVGGVYVVWHDARSGAGRLYAQHIAATGTRAIGWPEEGLELSASSGEQADPAASPDGTGGVLIAWADYRSGVASDLYMQRLTALGMRAMGWPAAGAAVCVGPGDIFHPTLGVVAMGAATLAWNEVGEDDLLTDVRPAPAPDRIAVQWLSQGLAHGELRVRFALIGSAPAALDVIDVAGRKVVRQPLERPTAGWHTATLGAEARLAPGVYFVRLTQAGRSAVAKVIVLR
jgi:hypothetical protein